MSTPSTPGDVITHPPQPVGGDDVIPDAVLEAMETKTGMDFRGAPRRLRRRPCRRCSWPVVTGLDADRCAGLAVVDPAPLTPLGESLARVKGYETYVIRSWGGMWVIDWRDPWQRATDAAGSLHRADVVPEHRCGTCWPVGTVTETRLPRIVTGAAGDEPPF